MGTEQEIHQDIDQLVGAKDHGNGVFQIVNVAGDDLVHDLGQTVFLDHRLERVNVRKNLTDQRHKTVDDLVERFSGLVGLCNLLVERVVAVAVCAVIGKDGVQIFAELELGLPLGAGGYNVKQDLARILSLEVLIVHRDGIGVGLGRNLIFIQQVDENRHHVVGVSVKDASDHAHDVGRLFAGFRIGLAGNQTAEQRQNLIPCAVVCNPAQHFEQHNAGLRCNLPVRIAVFQRFACHSAGRQQAVDRQRQRHGALLVVGDVVGCAGIRLGIQPVHKPVAEQVIERLGQQTAVGEVIGGVALLIGSNLCFGNLAGLLVIFHQGFVIVVADRHLAHVRLCRAADQTLQHAVDAGGKVDADLVAQERFNVKHAAKFQRIDVDAEHRKFNLDVLQLWNKLVIVEHGKQVRQNVKDRCNRLDKQSAFHPLNNRLEDVLPQIAAVALALLDHVALTERLLGFGVALDLRFACIIVDAEQPVERLKQTGIEVITFQRQRHVQTVGADADVGFHGGGRAGQRGTQHSAERAKRRRQRIIERLRISCVELPGVLRIGFHCGPVNVIVGGNIEGSLHIAVARPAGSGCLGRCVTVL